MKSLNRVDRVGRVDAKQAYMMKKKIDTEESIRSKELDEMGVHKASCTLCGGKKVGGWKNGGG